MAQDPSAEQDSPRNLGDGLVMRRATVADRERVADFHANTLLSPGEIGPLLSLQGFVLDLMSEDHPSSQAGDFTLVEDTATGNIVSSMCLTSKTWTYEGIPFPFGQPDIVSTNIAYRRRGLVRAQLEEIHRWSARRGELVQGITGIPWYYRQFGYELALNLDAGRAGYRSHVPALKEGEPEPYHFRAATPDDVPFIQQMYGRATARSVLASVRDEALWRYDLAGRHETSGFHAAFRVIETLSGEPVGLVVYSRRLWDGAIEVRLYEVTAGVPLLVVTPAVLRYLDTTGEAYAKRDGGEFQTLSFNLGEHHPLYETIPHRLPIIHKPYAWYIRVPDLPAFVRHIAPALEKRLAHSAQSGYTGALKISLYRQGLQLNFQAGSLAVEGWTPEHTEEGDALFPDLTFLQLLFCYRSMEELQYAYPDCWPSTDEARALLPVLFPKKSSNVWISG